jgi:general secretion pathway protein N
MGLSLGLERWRGRKAPLRGSSSLYAESTFAQLAWERRRRASMHWAWAGAACGALLALLAFAPASWLAAAAGHYSGQRLVLGEARGTVWNGSAVPVLTGGADSRSAALLDNGRLAWRIGLQGAALQLRLRQPCCIPDEAVLLLGPGLGRLTLQLQPGRGPIGEWPAAWLAGLGAPWNTLQPSGTLRLSSSGLRAEGAAGRWRLAGNADLELRDLGTAMAPLERLGSYRLHLDGGSGDQGPLFTLSTLDGALQLSGSGQWTGTQLRFRGEAQAAPGAEGDLDNVLNFFGRRQGARSILSIG